MFVIELKIVNDIGKVQTKATKPDTNLQFFSLCKEFYYLKFTCKCFPILVAAFDCSVYLYSLPSQPSFATFYR